MRLVLKLKPRNYRTKILFLILSLVFCLIIAFSGIVYFNVEGILVGNEFKSNQKNLSLIKYNVENMDSNISTLADSLYYNEDTQYLINNKDSEMGDIFFKVNNMRKVVASNNFLKDIYVYNNYKKVFYSIQKGISQNDEDLEAIIKQYNSIPVRKLLSVKEKSIDGQTNPEYKFYFAVNEGRESSDKFESALIFNIKTEWLFDSLKIANGIDSQKSDNVFLVTDRGEFIGADSYSSQAQKIIGDRLEKSIHDNKDSRFSYFREKIQGTDYLITYIIEDLNGWNIVRVQPYDVVYRYIGTIRLIVVITTLLALVTALIFAVTVSKKIYKPIGDLVNNIIEDQKEITCDSKDEIEILKDVYNLSNQKLQYYEKDRKANSEILKTFYLRNIITNSANISQEDMDKLLASGPEVCFQRQMLLGIVRIDNYKGFCEKYGSEDRELFKYAIENIVNEGIIRAFKVQATSMDQDKIIFFVNTNEEEGCSEELIQRIQEVQTNILRYLGFTVSITLSENIKDYKLLSKQYSATLANSNYRFLHGSQCIITPEKIKPNLENPSFVYPFEVEKELLKQIRAGKVDKCSIYLNQFFDEIQKMNYNNITLSIAFLFNSIKSVIDEVNQVRLDPINIDYNEYNQYLYEMESKELLFEKFLQLIGRLEKGRSEENSLVKKHAYLIDAIKDIISNNYSNGSICLNYVADSLKMSSRYIGKIFKEGTGISVAEYINDIRMTKAAELLVSTNMSVVDIMGKIGVEYESQFYKLFKAKYGVTPKEYTLKKVIKM